MVGTVKKSIETVVFTWFSRKVRHVCEGGFRRWTRYLLTLVSPMSMPSLRSSPWMRGAPQSGFSRLIFRISLRISFDTDVAGSSAVFEGGVIAYANAVKQ